MAGRGCTVIGHTPACAAQGSAPTHGGVAVCGSVCLCHAHRRRLPLKGVGTRTGRRHPQQGQPWVTGPPLGDGWGFMKTSVIDDDREVGHFGRWVRGLQPPQERTQLSIVFPWAEPLQPLPRRRMERPSQRVWLVGAGRHHCVLRALRHPRGADLRQEVEVAGIRQHHHFVCPQGVVRQANPGQAGAPRRGVIVRRQCGALPGPAQLMEPATDGFHRDCAAGFGLKRGGQGGTTPPGAASARGTWGFFEDGTQRAREPGHQDGRLDSHGALTIWIDTYAQYQRLRENVGKSAA
jgi:hypothetical protein